MTGPVALEVSVTSPAGARTAQDNGAARIELCSAAELGGLTPSAGLIEAVLAEVGGRRDGWDGVHVLLRPRPGDFSYAADELTVLRRDLDPALEMGVDGVVIGVLDDARRPDLHVLEELAGPAREAGATVTFHRALDLAADPAAAVDELASTGLVDRVLTSGGARTVAEGLEVLRGIVAAAAGRVEVMAGGGVEPGILPELLRLDVDAVHLSAKRRVAGAAGSVALGTDDDGGHWVTDPERVRAIADALARDFPRPPARCASAPSPLG